MDSDQFDDPDIEKRWCLTRRNQIAKYLEQGGLKHGRIADWPDWHVAPYVSIWAVESVVQPEWVGWWVICGDMPSDYVSSKEVKNPREAAAAIAKRWLEVAEYMKLGKPHPNFKIGCDENLSELSALLLSRAELLLEWSTDEEIWQKAKVRPN